MVTVTVTATVTVTVTVAVNESDIRRCPQVGKHRLPLFRPAAPKVRAIGAAGRDLRQHRRRAAHPPLITRGPQRLAGRLVEGEGERVAHAVGRAAWLPGLCTASGRRLEFRAPSLVPY